jgi:hypothetical protein
MIRIEHEAESPIPPQVATVTSPFRSQQKRRSKQSHAKKESPKASTAGIWINACRCEVSPNVDPTGLPPQLATPNPRKSKVERILLKQLRLKGGTVNLTDTEMQVLVTRGCINADLRALQRTNMNYQHQVIRDLTHGMSPKGSRGGNTWRDTIPHREIHAVDDEMVTRVFYDLPPPLLRAQRLASECKRNEEQHNILLSLRSFEDLTLSSDTGSVSRLPKIDRLLSLVSPVHEESKNPRNETYTCSLCH